MIRINLLPVKKSRRQEALYTELVLAGIGAGILILLLAFTQLWMAANVNEAKAENQRMTKEIEQLKDTVAKVDEIEKLKTDLQTKLQVIKQLKANKAGPVRLLDELAIATPEKLQLTSLDEDNGLVKLAGLAVSNEVISQFLSNLEASEYFSEVYLNAIDQAKGETLQLKNFSITMRLIVPGVEEAKAAAEGEAGAENGKSKAGN